jgi:hypothetical protein
MTKVRRVALLPPAAAEVVEHGGDAEADQVQQEDRDDPGQGDARENGRLLGQTGGARHHEGGLGRDEEQDAGEEDQAGRPAGPGGDEGVELPERLLRPEADPPSPGNRVDRSATVRAWGTKKITMATTHRATTLGPTEAARGIRRMPKMAQT